MTRYKPVSYNQALMVPVILNCNWGNGKMGAGVRLFVFDHF